MLMSIDINPGKPDHYSNKRLIIKIGKDFLIKNVEDIAYFFIEDKTSFLVEIYTGNKFIIARPLTHLQMHVDPARFFRINKKYLVNINAIEKFRQYKKGKIEIILHPDPKEQIIICQERGQDFKKWITMGESMIRKTEKELSFD